MGRYTIQRLLQMIPVIIGTTLLIFLAGLGIARQPVRGPVRRPALPRAIRPGDDREVQPGRAVVRPVRALHAATWSPVTSARRSTVDQVIDELARTYPITLKLAAMAIIFEVVIGIAAGDHGRPAPGRVPRQPGTAEHPLRDLHSDLRHRVLGSADLRRPARLVPGRPSRRRRPSTSCCFPHWSLPAGAWPTSRGSCAPTWSRTSDRTTCGRLSPRAWHADGSSASTPCATR